MTANDLPERQLDLLRTVAEGAGRWDARWIDIIMTTGHGTSETTVLKELKALEARALVYVDSSRGVGGRWAVTPEGIQYVGPPL